VIRPVLKNLEAAAAQRRSTSVAGIGAVVVVMVVLSGFAWWSISDAGQAGDQMRVEAAVGARYEQAATALARLQAAAAGYTLRPTHDSQSALTHAQLSMDAAVEHIGPAAADATDARTVAGLRRMDGVLDSGIERLRAAIMRGDAAQVVTIESKGVRQPTVAIRTLITQSIGRHNQRTAASLASSRAAGTRMKVVAIITGLLGTVVVLASLRMVLLRRRLAEAHTREVELLRSALVHDNLTGLRNHRGFLDDLGEATSRETACALLVLDLDDLRSVNDSQGHTAGDQLLIKLAGAMQAVAPDGATAYRVGGDEFAILTTRPLSR
jgi:CHASE3 domain sensor protein